MAERSHDADDLVTTPDPDETRDTERERVRFSNDRDQARERAGDTTPHARGYDEAVHGESTGDRGESGEDTDPDSATAEIDRDDIAGQ